MNVYYITAIGMLLCFLIISISAEKYFYTITIICINIIFFISVYYIEKDGFKHINYEIEKLEEICLNNKKGFLYTEMCYNKQECANLGNVIAYRDSLSSGKIQAVYFEPYKYQNKCNKDDSKDIIKLLNNMKDDFTILIN